MIHTSWLEFRRWMASHDKYGSKDRHVRQVIQARIDRRDQWRQRIWDWFRIDIG